MSKLFYDHLIIIEEIIFVLDKHRLSNEERSKFLRLIDETINHHVLDEILTHLPKADHQEFIEKFSSYPHDIGLMNYLKGKTAVDIEKKIMHRASKVKKDLIKEIEQH